MFETTVRLKPQEEWRRVFRPRWYSSWAPPLMKSLLRRVWPEETPMSWEQLTGEMNRHLSFPGWTNAWTMPIKTRVDMLSTGIRTPIGIKIFGTDLEAIERIGTSLERLIAPISGTRSVVYERNLGGLYIDIVPNREALARYGLRVGDVERVIEAAIGGAPISTSIEGRNRFSINVRYPQDMRSDLDRLQQVLVPIGSRGPQPAQAMPSAMSSAPSEAPRPASGSSRQSFIPLGQLAEIRIVGGPPMVRDEGGLLVGYVYVDIDPTKRDIGGYVDEAKAVVADAMRSGGLRVPEGYFLKWTGQYELLETMNARMKIVIPFTLMLVLVLLILHFNSVVEALIVLLSIPFALVGSIWLMWLLDYRFSTAVWVGVIALMGLAAQTGIVMIVYIDHAFEQRKRAGAIKNLDDIIQAHMEGTVMRVRPKLMTVATMLLGLIPLLWATGSGADVMKRIAAPMVGGLLTSAFLTLEIIPVISTYWRQEQLLHERLLELDPRGRLRLRALASIVGLACVGMLGFAVSRLYLDLSSAVRIGGEIAFALVMIAATMSYLLLRRGAKRLVWP
jgi:Cu(I)/Ag(I) efflux system membrane protein CusA/SilA